MRIIYSNSLGKQKKLERNDRKFDSRYRSEMRRSKAARSLKSLKFNNFRTDFKTDEEAFSKLTSELKRLSCMAHDED